MNKTFGELYAMKKIRLLGDKVQKNKDDQIRCHNKYILQNNGSANEGTPLSGLGSYYPLYDVRCFIVKSNDDLRQEVCCLQIMTLCRYFLYCFI